MKEYYRGLRLLFPFLMRTSVDRKEPNNYNGRNVNKIPLNYEPMLQLLWV